ncbi:MAG TPA: RNA 2',3'-cyclic phosphodiesterase [Motilibacterales bacterium]|nr:RNA 2',3'-cyclic phosphodiesterase [Motilibacterales bacterium]
MDSRLFLALWPDSASVEALAGILAPARQEAADVRWQPPERWHITMAFLGQADPEKTVRRVITHVATRLPAPAPIRLGLPGTFGPIIWVGVEHGPWLAELARGLQGVLRVADRQFRAHVTVGRVRGPDGSTRAREVVPLLSPLAGPAWTPTELTLVASTTGPAPEYRILERWPLGPAPAEERLPRTGDDGP